MPDCALKPSLSRWAVCAIECLVEVSPSTGSGQPRSLHVACGANWIRCVDNCGLCWRRTKAEVGSGKNRILESLKLGIEIVGEMLGVCANLDAHFASGTTIELWWGGWVILVACGSLHMSKWVHCSLDEMRTFVAGACTSYVLYSIF